MKLTVLGGGGVRSMFLAKSLAQTALELGINHIVFMDNNPIKLNIYGRMAKEVAKRIQPNINFVLTEDPVEAVIDANYIITTIRVGGDSMRVRDERIALERGVLGQETSGAAGFSFAMRSVDALSKYCELIKTYSSKDVKVFNFTNPAGIVSQTLRDMGYDFTIGICDAPSSLLNSIANRLHVTTDRITGTCYGLNHLSFFNSILLDGKEILPELLEDSQLYIETDMRFFEKDLVQHFGCLINEYLYYYYYREKAINNILSSHMTRGELIQEVNDQMTMELSQYNIEKEFDQCIRIFNYWYGKREDAYMQNETGVDSKKGPFHFDIYSKEIGGYAGVALNYIKLKQSHENGQMILCVPNQNAISGLEYSDVVEITCSIKEGQISPCKIENPGGLQMSLIRTVKEYERLGSQALREKSISKAVECLMVHPLVNSYSLAKELVKEYLDANKEYTGEWK